ncbi:hypothetical protein [Psychromonas sp. KJ10-2]
MRKNYPERREMSTLTVTMSDKWQISPQIIDLKKIGFTVKNK